MAINPAEDINNILIVFVPLRLFVRCKGFLYERDPSLRR